MLLSRGGREGLVHQSDSHNPSSNYQNGIDPAPVRLTIESS